jgi:steroid delta-isomerase-like uncharacterized protein
MSTQTVETVRNVMAAIDRNDWDAARAGIAPDFKLEFPGSEPIDAAAFIDFCAGWYAAFPDLRHDIEEAFSEDDRVCMRFVVRGTHQGEFMGIPATGRAIAMDSMGIGTVRDGRVTRLVALPNLLGMMQQLGVIPAPAAV